MLGFSCYRTAFQIRFLLRDCFKYSVAINNHAQEHPFPTESLILAFLLSQHKLINHLKPMISSKHSNNEIEDGWR
jgi:hypothetical protein